MCGFAATAQADSIGVHFTGGAANLGAADQPGVVPGANWNSVINPTSSMGISGSGIALNDNTGAATTALLSYTADGTYDGFGPTNFANSATNALYHGGLFGNRTNNTLNPGTDITITVTNIPYAKYDVYSYASQDTTATNTLSISNGTTTYYYASNGSSNAGATSLLLTTSTNPLSPTLGPAQYQIFSEMTASSFTLTTAGSIILHAAMSETSLNCWKLSVMSVCS